MAVFLQNRVNSLIQVGVGWLAASHPIIIPFYFGYELLGTPRDHKTIEEIGEYLVGYAAHSVFSPSTVVSPKTLMQ